MNKRYLIIKQIPSGKSFEQLQEVSVARIAQGDSGKWILTSVPAPMVFYCLSVVLFENSNSPGPFMSIKCCHLPLLGFFPLECLWTSYELSGVNYNSINDSCSKRVLGFIKLCFITLSNQCLRKLYYHSSDDLGLL